MMITHVPSELRDKVFVSSECALLTVRTADETRKKLCLPRVSADGTAELGCFVCRSCPCHRDGAMHGPDLVTITAQRL